MKSGRYQDPYADIFAGDAGDDDFDPAKWPANKPGRPYGVYPEPPGLRRPPGAPMDPGTAKPTSPAPASAPTPSPAPAAAPPAAPAPEPSPAPATSAAPAEPAAPQPASTAAAAGPAAAVARRRPARPRRAPDPENPLPGRREAFCQAFVVRGNASRAALEAGYSVVAAGNQGYRLLRRPEVKARIAAIHRELGADLNRDADVLLGKLEAVYRRAVDGGYLNAAARIVELQARMAGRLARGNAEKTKNDEK